MFKVVTIGKNEKREIILEFPRDADSGDLTVELAGEGAEVEIKGIVKGSGNEEIKMATRVVHKAPNTKSATRIRAALDGKSLNDFAGLIRVEPEAKGAEASLRYDALLLSHDAKAKALPSLEILTDDAKVHHAATISNVDPEKLFYLQSRGLAREEAEKVIADGFLSAVSLTRHEGR